MSVSYDFKARRCNLIHAGSQMLKERYLLGISPSKLNEIVGDDLDDEVENEDDIYDPNSPCMDTIVREMFLDCVSYHYFGHPWPCNADGFDMNYFYLRLVEEINNDV